MDTLAFGYILPTTGRIPDFHRLETCAAGRTEKEQLTHRNGCQLLFHFIQTFYRLLRRPGSVLFFPECRLQKVLHRCRILHADQGVVEVRFPEEGD